MRRFLRETPKAEASQGSQLESSSSPSSDGSSSSSSGSSSSSTGSSSDSSDSSSSSAEGQMEATHLSSLQEYILDLPEEEWIAFSSLLNTPMTRVQFAELCMSILKVVSLSSFAVVLPAYVGVAKDSASSGSSTEGSSGSSSYSSSRTTSAWSGDDSSAAPSLMDRLKSALGILRKETPAVVSDDAISHASFTSQASTAHDLTCLTLIIEDLLSNGDIPTIARNLVHQVQGVLQERSRAPSIREALFGSAPKQTPSATELVHSYAEEAIKNLLEPYFLPLLAWSAATEAASSRVPSSRGVSPTSTLLGLKAECSCLLTTLIQQLPGTIQYPAVEAVPTCRRTDVANLFARLMTYQVMEMIDLELGKYGERLGTPSLSSRAGAIDQMEDSLFTGLINRFMAEFRFTDTPLPDSGEESRASSRSRSARSATRSEAEMARDTAAAQKLKDVLNVFTRVMVHQVMDVVHMEEMREKAAISLTQQMIRAASPSPLTPLSLFTSTDNGCLVTVLMLRLLAKIQEQQTASSDMAESARELTGQILSKLSDASGTPSFQCYEGNVKIQMVYNSMDQFLLQAYGPEGILQRAVETQDAQFDLILLTALKEQLLQPTPVVTTSPPASVTLAPAADRCDTASSSIPQFQLSPGVQTATSTSPAIDALLNPVAWSSTPPHDATGALSASVDPLAARVPSASHNVPSISPQPPLSAAHDESAQSPRLGGEKVSIANDFPQTEADAQTTPTNVAAPSGLRVDKPSFSQKILACFLKDHSED